MTEKQKYRAMNILPIIFFSISIFLMLGNDSIPTESYSLQALGWITWSVAQKKEKEYKKSNKTNLS